MLKFAAPAALLLLTACAAPAPSGDTSATTQEEIHRLIAQLGAEDIEAREAAMDRFLLLGKEAEPAVREALAHPDPEVRARAMSVLRDFPLLADHPPGTLIFTVHSNGCMDLRGAILLIPGGDLATFSSYLRHHRRHVLSQNRNKNVQGSWLFRAKIHCRTPFALKPQQWLQICLAIKQNGGTIEPDFHEAFRFGTELLTHELVQGDRVSLSTVQSLMCIESNRRHKHSFSGR